MNPSPLEAVSVYPANVIVFTDRGSVWHVILGAVSGLSPAPWNLAVAAMFTGYEVSKLGAGESAERTGGKFVEFGIGLVIAGLLRLAGGTL